MAPPPKNPIKVKRDEYGNWRYMSRADRHLKTGFAGPAQISEGEANENAQIAIYGQVLWPQMRTTQPRQPQRPHHHPQMPRNNDAYNDDQYEEGEYEEYDDYDPNDPYEAEARRWEAEQRQHERASQMSGQKLDFSWLEEGSDDELRAFYSQDDLK